MTASNKSKTVHLTYHHEDDSWWAESEEIPGLFAGGDNLDDAKALARQVVSDEFGDDVLLAEWMPMPGALETFLGGAEDKKPASEGGGLGPGPETLKSWPDEEGPSQSVEPELEYV